MLVAADTNVLMDLAAEVESVVDTLGETEDERLAVKALQSLTHWGFEPVNFLPVEYGITEQIALRLRRAGLLPETEINDSFILAEAALLGCGLIVSSDAHFTSLDFQRLTLELKASDVSVPAIGSPQDIVRKFYR